MSHDEGNNESRRRFMKIAAGTTAAALMLGALPRFTHAADLPHVTDSDPTAKTLGYVEDASTSKNSLYKAGNICANCQFYSGASTGYGPCQLFPGKAVNSQGWCSSYTPKKA